MDVHFEIPAKFLRGIRRGLSPQGLRDTLRAVGIRALHDVRRDFTEASEPGNPRWRPLGNVTVIMRRPGSFGKIYGPEDIVAKRATIKKLRDTNELYMSLSPGRLGNVLNVERYAVQVGSNLRRAARHQRGGSSVFRFDEARFDRNVSPVKRGFRKPRALKSGKRRQWKAQGKESPWNPFYFKTRGGLRKMSGKSYRVPKRVIVRTPDAGRVATYAKIVQVYLGRMVRRAERAG